MKPTLHLGYRFADRRPQDRRNNIDKIKVIHDTIGHTLTVWFDESEKEYICQETSDEVIIIKDAGGRVIGFELLHYRPTGADKGLAVETIVQTGS